MCWGTCQHLVCNKSSRSSIHTVQHRRWWRSTCTTLATSSETRTCRRRIKEKDNKRRRGRGRRSRRRRASRGRVTQEKEGKTWTSPSSCSKTHRSAGTVWKRYYDWAEVEGPDSELEYNPLYLKLHWETHYHLQRWFKDTKASTDKLVQKQLATNGTFPSRRGLYRSWHRNGQNGNLEYRIEKDCQILGRALRLLVGY